MDLWVYQELICALKIDLLIETGTAAGGTALFFADLFERLGTGHVVSIDIRQREGRPIHPRITYLTGSSLSRGVLDVVQQHFESASAVMAILDSDHKAPFKLLELAAYAPFVTVGSYLIAEDTAFDHYPAFPEYGPGPAKAVAAFVAAHPEFQADRKMEKHLITFAPMAFLRKRASE